MILKLLETVVKGWQPTADKTDAFYSRFIMVQFPNQFPKGKDIVDTIPTEEYDNLLAKCIDVLRDLLERGEFTNEGGIRANGGSA